MADEKPQMSKQKQNQKKQRELQQQQQKQKPPKPNTSEDDAGSELKGANPDAVRQNRSNSSSDNKGPPKERGSQSQAPSGGRPNQAQTKPQSQQSAVSKPQSQHSTVSDVKNLPHIALFDHLQRKSASLHTSITSIEGDTSLHPATIKLGALYRLGFIREDDDRVCALLSTFGIIIQDYTTPPNISLNRDLDKHITHQVQHLVECRRHSMGMGNVIKFVRYAISQVPPSVNEAEAKDILLKQIFNFNEERIVFA
eukprot:gene12341-25966_t